MSPLAPCCKRRFTNRYCASPELPTYVPVHVPVRPPLTAAGALTTVLDTCAGRGCSLGEGCCAVSALGCFVTACGTSAGLATYSWMPTTRNTSKPLPTAVMTARLTPTAFGSIPVVCVSPAGKGADTVGAWCL